MRVDLEDQEVVAILTRAPSAAGKTRLFRELGCAPDPKLLVALLLDTLEAVAAPHATRVVCFTPPAAEPEMQALVPAGVLLLPQRNGDLGDRMRFVFDDLLARGAASVVLIGSDLPGIVPSTVAAAHRILRDRPRAIVLGPAHDGGYYLVGATRTPAALFAEMEWGTAQVLSETERRARIAGFEIVPVAPARDVDTVDDLRALVAGDAPAPRTRAALERGGSGWHS
jgi:rSAM/selenodomain-associated transferase 1